SSSSVAPSICKPNSSGACSQKSAPCLAAASDSACCAPFGSASRANLPDGSGACGSSSAGSVPNSTIAGSSTDSSAAPASTGSSSTSTDASACSEPGAPVCSVGGVVPNAYRPAHSNG